MPTRASYYEIGYTPCQMWWKRKMTPAPRQISLVSRSSSYRKRRIGNLATAPMPAPECRDSKFGFQKQCSSLISMACRRWACYTGSFLTKWKELMPPRWAMRLASGHECVRPLSSQQGWVPEPTAGYGGYGIKWGFPEPKGPSIVGGAPLSDSAWDHPNFQGSNIIEAADLLRNFLCQSLDPLFSRYPPRWIWNMSKLRQMQVCFSSS